MSSLNGSVNNGSSDPQGEETTVVTKPKAKSVFYDFLVNELPDKKDKRFKSNMISTCKYTWWNFIPKNLFI
jgi:Phospholipid-translocating ATPase N-terminal